MLKVLAGLLIVVVGLSAQVRADNVLVRMVPPGTESLVGAHMDELKTTTLYQKMMAAQKIPELDRFAKETGFDPRTDVRELLFASTKQGGVLLARGKFQVKVDFSKPEIAQHAKLLRHGNYNIYTSTEPAGKAETATGFCILDATLAAAGNLSVLEAALDEWKAGKHLAARPLLDRVKTMDTKMQFWGVSTGFANFVAEHMPRMTNGGVDFSKIFRDVEDTWFQMDLSKGFRADIRGTTSNEQDAVSLRDAAKGLVGFGRLSVPENQPELLRLWDGITVEQSGKGIAIHADIAQDLMDKLVQMLEMNQQRGPGMRSGKKMEQKKL